MEWCSHRLFRNNVLLFACRNWRNATGNLSGNGLLVEDRIRSFPNTKQESLQVSRYIWTKVFDMHKNIFARARTRIRTWCFNPGVWNANCVWAKQTVLRFQVGRMSFRAIKKEYLKLITALRLFSTFNNNITVCYIYCTLKLYCIVSCPDLGCTLPSRDDKMFRIGERVMRNELLGRVFETVA